MATPRRLSDIRGEIRLISRHSNATSLFVASQDAVTIYHQ